MTTDIQRNFRLRDGSLVDVIKSTFDGVLPGVWTRGSSTTVTYMRMVQLKNYRWTCSMLILARPGSRRGSLHTRDAELKSQLRSENGTSEVGLPTLSRQKECLDHHWCDWHFQHKEELAMRSFDAKVTSAFHSPIYT